LGYTYNDEKAIVLNSNYKRHLLNLKGDYKITKNLKAGVSTRYTNQMFTVLVFHRSKVLLTAGCVMLLNTDRSYRRAGY
jgi:hypothetical protein